MGLERPAVPSIIDRPEGRLLAGILYEGLFSRLIPGTMTGRAVFLDRDGVLNRALMHDGKPYSPASVSEFEVLADAPGACRRLKSAGFMLIVVTNQPEVARGMLKIQALESIHRVLQAQVSFDDLRTCNH